MKEGERRRRREGERGRERERRGGGREKTCLIKTNNRDVIEKSQEKAMKRGGCGREDVP